MKLVRFVFHIVLVTMILALLLGCGNNRKATSNIVVTLREYGYSEDRAVEIENVLKSVGITDIEVYSITGYAEIGTNYVGCYPNGSVEDYSRISIVTEDGVLVQVKHEGRVLYDSSKGGILEQYAVNPDSGSEVGYDQEVILMMMTEDVAKQISNYPATVDFDLWSWGFWRNGYTYAVQGTFTCTNAFGVPEEYVIRLICEASSDYSRMSAKEVYLNGQLIKAAN